MAIKMRVLCYPENNKKLRALAEMIKAEYDLSVNSVDRIPPRILLRQRETRYPCNSDQG